MAFVPAGGERDVDFMYDDDLDLGGREDEYFDISSSEVLTKCVALHFFNILKQRTSFDRVAVVEEKIWSAKITSGNKSMTLVYNTESGISSWCQSDMGQCETKPYVVLCH